MDYTRLVIHPLGDDKDTIKVIQDIVEEFNGIFDHRQPLGMTILEGKFPDGGEAKDCMDKLSDSEDVSHVEWIEGR